MSLDKLPGVAEVAMQTGLYTGHRIRRRAEGNMAEKPFRYHDLGSAAYISRGRAVVSAGPLKVGGFIGWVIWLFIHIAFLTGFRNRVGALLTWWLTFGRNLRRERAFTTQQMETRDVYTVPLGGTPLPPGDESSPAPSAESTPAPSSVTGGGKAAHP
jgi:NADH:ubiquinone reductase (H+-translocating)